MDNVFENAHYKGYSKRAYNIEFQSEIKKQVKRNFRNTMIAAPIVFAVIVLLTVIIAVTKDINMGIIAAADAIVLIVVIAIMIGYGIALMFDLNKLKRDGVEAAVIKNEKWYTLSGRNGSRIKYRIVLKTDDGKKFKVKNRKARPYHTCISDGDRVMYHPGYPFPIEIYDKTKNNVNICVFCGTENEAASDNCAHCNKQMLV